MFSIRKINPMARAIGTMGAVAALVGAVTYADLTSNTVTLTNNTLASATAHLVIAAQTDCSEVSSTTATGMNFSHLVPGVQSDPFTFCLGNHGDIPLDITAKIPTDISASTIPANKVTLDISCGSLGTIHKTLADLSTAQAFSTNPLDNETDNNVDYTVKATLDSGFSGSGSVTPFQLNFVGTQVET